MPLLLIVGSIILSVLGLLSEVVTSRRRASGWLLAMLVCVLSFPYDVVTRQYGYLAEGVVGLVIAWRAWRSWRRSPARGTDLGVFRSAPGVIPGSRRPPGTQRRLVGRQGVEP